MAILQSQINELRYIKRQNLEQEAKVVGNWYRDLIRSYSVDCNYYKLKIPYPEDFKSIVNDNNLILHAYGYDPNPDYSVSADMLTYMEIDSDIFNLNKFGLIPNMDVNFYFDSKDFACSLAYKLGKFIEYKIPEVEIVSMVPEFNAETSADVFPFLLGLGYAETFETDLVSGKISVEIGPYNIPEDKDVSDWYTVTCNPYNIVQTALSAFPVNEYIYKSFDYIIRPEDCLETLIFLTYQIHKIPDRNKYKYLLKGKLHGGVLFRDLTTISKYVSMIHPEIGDIISIDFPDDKSREQFEITDCYDKQLTTDGINPLLHKYIWKCKARRYINGQEDFPEENEANQILDEKLDLVKKAGEEIAAQISYYDDNEDAHYGTYSNDKPFNDRLDIDKNKPKYVKLDENETISILSFGVGSELLTDGYNLYFKTQAGCLTQISLEKVPNPPHFKSASNYIQYIKATDSQLVFINIESEVLKICENKEATKGEIELCLNSLFNSTIKAPDSDKNTEGDNFFKFPNCQTLLWSTPKHLYCRLESNGKLYLLA